MTIGGPVCLCSSFIASLFSAALRHSRTAGQQKASTYHSPFHPSCPHSRCHGHRPNGRECSADYHNDTRSLCKRVELRGNRKNTVESTKCGCFLISFFFFKTVHVMFLHIMT